MVRCNIHFICPLSKWPLQKKNNRIERFKTPFFILMLLIVGCSGSGSGETTSSYMVGGNVSGLTGTLDLQNSGDDDLMITFGGAFAFATPVAYGNSYNVALHSRPAGQSCVVSSGVGTVPAHNVSDISISCETVRYVTNGNVYSMALGFDGTTYIGFFPVTSAFGIRFPAQRLFVRLAI